MFKFISISTLIVLLSCTCVASEKKSLAGNYNCYTSKDFNKKGEKNSLAQSSLELYEDGTYRYTFYSDYTAISSKWKIKDKSVVLDIKTTKSVNNERLAIKGKKLTIMAGGWLTKTPLTCTK